MRQVYFLRSLSYAANDGFLAGVGVFMGISIVLVFKISVTVLAMINLLIAVRAYVQNPAISMCRLRSHNDDAFKAADRALPQVSYWSQSHSSQKRKVLDSVLSVFLQTWQTKDARRQMLEMLLENLGLPFKGCASKSE